MCLIVLAGLKNPRAVSAPFKDEGSLFFELDLDDPAGSMRLARHSSAPTGSGRRLPLAWAGVPKDGEHIKGSTKSWDNYVVGHARVGLGGLASVVRIPSMSVFGSAMLCQVLFCPRPLAVPLPSLLARATHLRAILFSAPERTFSAG